MRYFFIARFSGEEIKFAFRQESLLLFVKTKYLQRGNMKIRLLRKVQKAILAEPELFDMSENHKCIAGWAAWVDTGNLNPLTFDQYAQLLGMDDRLMEPERLFYVNNWPKRFRNAYRKAVKPLTRAKVAVARIDDFIATKGKK